MQHITKYVIALLLCLTASTAWAKRADKIPVNYEVEELGIGVEGTKVFKSWAYGTSADKAAEEAKRCAVAACIFRGTQGTPALCSDPQAMEIHRAFFENFFDPEEGYYKQFVNLTNDGMASGKDRIKLKWRSYKVGVSVQITHQQLREYLESKGIIKKLTHGFY